MRISSATVLGAVLLFVVSMTATADSPYAAPANKAASWLASYWTTYGSLFGGYDAAAPIYTAEAIVAWRSTAYRSPAYYSAIAWLGNHSATSVDHLARRINALALNGSSVGSDYDAVVAAQRTSGGWGLDSAYQGSPLDTALALQVGPVSYYGPWLAAVNYLRSTQLTGADLGWPYNPGLSSTSDAAVTAHAVIALSRFKSLDSSLTLPINNAVNTLIQRVTTTSSTYLRALTALALLRAGKNADGYLTSLTSSQQANGSFDNNVFVTAVALRAFGAAMGTDSPESSEWIQDVYVPDANLRAAINAALGRNAMDGLYKSDLARLTSLTAVNVGIADLTGLQAATNLTYLDVRNNQITSTSPLTGLSNLTTVLLDGNPVAAPANKPPVLTADVAVAVAGYPVLIDALANDSDPNGDAITLVSVTAPSHGTAQVVGSKIQYTATATFAGGADSFTYTAKDSKAATASATVSVTVYAKYGDEDGDGISNYDEMVLGTDIFTNEGAILMLLQQMLGQ